MTFLSWRNDYEVQHSQIDSEHRELFRLVNEFHDKSSSKESQVESSQTLSKLVAYAEEHFQHEEALMEIAGYPQLEHHRELHVDLVSSIFDLNSRLAADSVKLNAGTLSFLKNWLVEHIVHEDMDFRDFRLRQIKQAKSAAEKEAQKKSEEVESASTPIPDGGQEHHGIAVPENA
jgi:hemerythrin